MSISVLDILISLFYVLLILGIANLFKPKSSTPYSKYYLPFIWFKIFAAIVFVLLHVYYYRGGDTFLYYSGATFFSTQVTSQPLNGISLFFSSQFNMSNYVYDAYSYYALNSSVDVFFMSKIVGVFALITFNQYLATSIVFTLVTAIGIWKLFQVMCELFPNLHKYFAFGILFYPSLGIWGSGVLKDPLTLASVGIIFHSVYLLIYKRKVVGPIISIIICTYFCFRLKPYILYTFIPIMFLWTQGIFSEKLSNPALKVVLTPILVAIFSIGGYFALNQVSAGAGKYSLESVQSVAEGFNSWHQYLAETRDQSGYSLGQISFTPLGILQKAPEGFFVTYYRPFIIGDVRNIATLFEAIQTFILLILTIYVIIKVGFLNFFKFIISNTHVRAFMIFAIVFGIAVGLTSYNFGALSRYKIPSLPFFTSALIIIYYLGYLKPKGKMGQ